MKSKYRNKKVTVDGIKFDSKKECEQYLIYKHLRGAKKIKHFRMQVPYILIPSQKDPVTKKVIERACIYKLDFLVTNNDDSLSYIEVKGWNKKTNKFLTTPDYVIKRKLMLKIHGIRLEEV